jgi:hypothetical protein
MQITAKIKLATTDNKDDCKKTSETLSWSDVIMAISDLKERVPATIDTKAVREPKRPRSSGV